MQIKSVLVGCAAAVLVAAPAFSQTPLANVARQEEARRETVKTPSKVYTNSSLKPDPNVPIAVDGARPTPPPSMFSPATPNPGPAAASNATPATAAAPKPPAAAQPDEALWRHRAVEVRARVEKMRAEVAKLTGPKHDDPREQAKLDALLKRAQSAFAQAEESLKAFQREAAAVGVPPNWIQ